jgi:hypothetical protein
LLASAHKKQIENSFSVYRYKIHSSQQDTTQGPIVGWIFSLAPFTFHLSVTPLDSFPLNITITTFIMSPQEMPQTDIPDVPMAIIEEASSNRIRANLLNRLGIDQRAEEQPKQRKPSRGSLLGKVQVTQEPLKYQQDEVPSKSPWAQLFGTPEENVSLASSPSSVSSGSMSQKSVGVSFNTEVKVVPIPMRDEYSKRVKERLWTNAEDLQLNAQRNAYEFAAEGWDWRTALEDENMYRDSSSGELIHPVHCMPPQQE